MAFFKRSKILFFGLPCLLPICTIPLVTCCSCSNEDSGVPVNDNFLGFENDQIKYKFPFSGQGEDIFIPIIKKSDTYYTIAQPLEVYIGQTPELSFSIITKGEYVSKRMRFFVDESTPNHAISIITKSYVDEVPDMTVLNDKVRRDSIFVQFECNEQILFELPYRVWRTSSSKLNLLYHKKSPQDRHMVSATPNLGYRATLLCNKNGYTEDTTNNFTIICKPFFSEYIDFKFQISPNKGSSAQPFLPAISYAITYEKFEMDDSFYYCIYVSYTFLAHITPSYEQCKGDSPNIFTLKIFDTKDDKTTRSFCDFEIWWI